MENGKPSFGQCDLFLLPLGFISARPTAPHCASNTPGSLFTKGLWRFFSKILTQPSPCHSGLNSHGSIAGNSSLTTQSKVTSLYLYSPIIFCPRYHQTPDLTLWFTVPSCPDPLHLFIFLIALNSFICTIYIYFLLIYCWFSCKICVMRTWIIVSFHCFILPP